MKKRKLKNFLKTGTLSLLISLFINCSYDESSEIEFSENQKIQNEFSLDNFNDLFIKDNLIVDWNDFNIEDSNKNGFVLYEFNTSLNTSKSIESGKYQFSFRYKVLVAKNSQNSWSFEIIKFLANDDKDLSNTSYFSIDSFSGTLYHYNLKGETLKVKGYEKGNLINEFKNKDSSLFSKQENIETNCSDCFAPVYTEHYTDWYKSDGNGGFTYTHSVLNRVSVEFVYIPGPNQNITYHSHETPSYISNTVSSNNHGNELVLDVDEISNNLAGKALCVYNKMVNNSNNINWILENFLDGNKPSQFNLNLQMSTTLGNGTNASTATPAQSGMPNTFVISINQNRSENINTMLTVARTILHEGIHARLWEFYYRDGVGVTPNDFPGIYEHMRIYGKNWDHEQMAAFYRTTIAEGLKQFDNAQHTDEYYDALAWEGLSEIKDANNNHDLIYIYNCLE